MQRIEKTDNRFRTLKVSAIAISSVLVVETSVGLLAGSLAILSDGFHALLDALTMLGLCIATRASLKPPDAEHMYGHEKFESLGGLVGGIVLIGAALLIMFESIVKLLENKPYVNLEFGFAGFFAICYTFCIDFFRVGTFRKAVNSRSQTMKAGFYHALADLGSTAIALVGFGLATSGFYYGDPFASIVLSVLLSYLSFKLVWNSGMELTDTAPKDVVNEVMKQIISTKHVCKCKSLKVRRAGTKTFVEATVKVPEDMRLEEAHALTSKIEANIEDSVGEAETTIHVEPLETETPIEELVEKTASEVEGVKEIHQIAAVRSDGKLYITLHAWVDSKLSVDEAHEVAEKIRSRIGKRASGVENVTVHVEPSKENVQKGPEVDENEVKETVHRIVENFPQVIRCNQIITYSAEGKRYVNIDCSFARQTPIKDAHRIASQIERSIKKQFGETVVTVHIEPES